MALQRSGYWRLNTLPCIPSCFLILAFTGVSIEGGILIVMVHTQTYISYEWVTIATNHPFSHPFSHVPQKASQPETSLGKI